MKNEVILLVGGAGYIGSHVNKLLHRAGYSTIVLDNLSRGHREAVRAGVFFEGDLCNGALLDAIFSQYAIAAVMHFAAFIDVGESVKDPLKYYVNNVSHTLNLLHAMLRHDVKKIVFSSTAAIFGFPREDKINEQHLCHPINPYGETKWTIEKILRDFDSAYGLKFCCLRYFNAAGGDPEGEIKNYQLQPHNLIPRILLSLKKKNDCLVTINGTDYPTRDGTCIRDYIHIEDLGCAHIKAMEQLFRKSESNCYNLGNGKGYTVREVIRTAEKVLGKKVQILEGPRRTGDPAVLLADPTRANAELNWFPQHHLEEMIQDAWLSYSEVMSNN